jgi:hypothetical protein
MLVIISLPITLLTSITAIKPLLALLAHPLSLSLPALLRRKLLLKKSLHLRRHHKRRRKHPLPLSPHSGHHRKRRHPLHPLSSRVPKPLLLPHILIPSSAGISLSL